MTRGRWLMAQLTRRLWVRATLVGSLGVLAAVLAAVVDRYIPWQLPGSIGADAVDSVLTIMASSMLAVTTFSLSIMVSAFGSATSNVTPRATRLLVEDRLTQTVLSTFIGSFLFGMVGLVVLKTGAYGERGRVVLFAFTILVIVLVVISLLRWIDHLTSLGRVGETTDRVERAARAAIERRLDEPYLGGQPLPRTLTEMPSGYVPVLADAVGYVQYLDMSALSGVCEACDTDVYVRSTPGTFVYRDTPLAWVRGTSRLEDQEDWQDTVRQAFMIGEQRSFDQDPRFGLAVMSEIGSRALSPATNDPGTAIDVIGRLTRLLSLWAAKRQNTVASEPRYPRVRVPALASADLFEDAFMTMARDGAALIEVQLRLQKCLIALSRVGDLDCRLAAEHQSRMALARAHTAMTLDADKSRLNGTVEAHFPPVASRKVPVTNEASAPASHKMARATSSG